MAARQLQTPSPYTDALAHRLRQVTGRFSLSEIARRTGMPVSCIHGYLNGTRIPAELFSGLAEHFGVNPAWLHTGQGAPYSTDVAPETATMAEDVLKLVQSMEAVGKMRLGAMQGEQPKVRALEEALKRHDDLQQRLSDQTATVMKKLIGDADKALDVRNYDAAEAALATADRMRRLCTDADLNLRLTNTRAILARMRGQLEKAVAGFRETFLQVLPVRERVGRNVHLIAFNYSNALQLMGELREAIVVADGMLILGDQQASVDRAILEGQRGWLDVHAGELHRGLSRMAANLPAIDQPRRSRVEAPRYMAAQLFAGLLDFDAALATSDESPNKGAFLAIVTLAQEDTARVSAIYDRYFAAATGYIEDSKGRMSIGTSLGRYVAALVEALRDGKLDALDHYANHVAGLCAEGLPPAHKFAALVNLCQLSRLAGDRTRARKSLKLAQQCLAELPKAVTPDFLDLARHQRNVLQLPGRGAEAEAAQGAAKSWLSDMVSRGYQCLRNMA